MEMVFSSCERETSERTKVSVEKGVGSLRSMGEMLSTPVLWPTKAEFIALVDCR